MSSSAAKAAVVLPLLEDEELSSGSIVHHPERNGHRVPVTCGKCKLKRLVRVGKLEAHETYTGLCNRCRATKYTEDITNPLTNSRFLYSQKTADGVPVVCGRCPADHLPRIVPDPDPKGTGYCAEHCHEHRKHSNEEPHSSGAMILWAERDPETRFRVAFLCANRDKDDMPDCFKKDVTWTVEVRRDGWRGLCAACRKRVGSVRRLSANKRFSTGVEIFWSKGTETHVPVFCPRCTTTHDLSRDRAHQIQRKRGDWVCRKSFKSCYAAFKRHELLLIPSEMSSLISKGNGKRGPGRPPKIHNTQVLSPEDEKLKARFENIVLGLDKFLPPNKIKRKTVVKAYHDLGELIDASTVTKRVQILYEPSISVDDAIALVLTKKRENNPAN